MRQPRVQHIPYECRDQQGVGNDSLLDYDSGTTVSKSILATGASGGSEGILRRMATSLDGHTSRASTARLSLSRSAMRRAMM
jgi:hypothetical protein